MANPRKFSEKIALHNQKQAEETAAFEAIIRDVHSSTRGAGLLKQNQHLHIQHNIMYRGGSLPNVNQMVNSSAMGQDIQTALHLEGMRGNQQNRIDRMHPRDRGRQPLGPGPLRTRPFNMEKSRADCSPYGSGAYLSPPPDTSWRRMFRHLNGVSHLSRTNSDSAIHSSSSLGGSTGDMHSPNTPPLHRRIQEVAGENPIAYPWDPKKLQQRPKSCEVPNINIYPSAEQDSQMSLTISGMNNTGSLPDLSILQFPSPLTTPLDIEDHANNYTGSPNLSPTSAHMNMVQPQHPNGSPAQSPGQRRRMNPSGPSPLVLTANGSQNMRMPHSSPPVSTIDPSRLHMDPRMRPQFMLYQQTRHGASRGQCGAPCVPTIPGQGSPTNSSQNSHDPNADSPRVPPPHMGPVPKVCITSHEGDPPEPSLTQYRNNISETGCQSPTSPHSQTSYSPSQSPGLPSQNWNSPGAFEMDPYTIQQQQQTNALQQRFEHFNMMHDNQQQQQKQQQQQQHHHQQQQNSADSVGEISCTSSAITSPLSSSLNFSQANTQQGNNGGSPSLNQDINNQQFFFDNNVSLQSRMMHMLNSQSLANSRIPDIILTGMNDSSFDAEFFGSVSDEALKDGLDPIDLDGLQMLTDPSMVADADTENSFRLDQL